MFRTIEVRGKDSLSFFIKIFASSVQGIQKNEARKGLYLDGSSKVLGQFDLICMSSENFFLLTFSEQASDLKTEIEKMIFAEEIFLSERDEVFSLKKKEGAKSIGKRMVDFDSQPLTWDSWIEGYQFCKGNLSLDKQTDFARISSMVPWPNKEWKIRETYALDAGFYSWIDRKKGCYPGQEVVEKSLNLGHPGKMLFLAEGSEGIPKFQETKDLELCSILENFGKIRALVRCRWKDKDLPLKGGWKKLQDSIPMEGIRHA